MNRSISNRINQITQGKIPEDYKKTKIGVIPKEWDVLRLSKIAKRIQRKNDGNEHPVLTISSLRGFLNQSDRFSKVIAGKNLEKYTLLKKGEFSYNKGNSKTFPYGCIFKLEDYDTAVIPNVYYSFSITNDSKEFYKQYFELGKLNQQLARVINTGVRNDGLLNLSVDDFFKCYVIRPYITEQIKIAEMLSTWDKVIELKEKLIEEKKKQKTGLMQKLLVGEVRLSEFESEWEEIPFENLFRKLSTKNHQIKSNEYLVEGIYPVVDQGKTKIVGYSNDKDKVLKCPNSGAIVFGDHTRELKYIDFDFIVGADGTQVLVEKNKHNLKYLYYQLENREIPNNGYSRHYKFLREMVFSIPEYGEQCAIANILTITDNEIFLLEKELEAIKLQKKGLMQLLLTGIIRVNTQEN